MRQRQFKFRAWDGEKMISHDGGKSVGNPHIDFNGHIYCIGSSKHWELMQFTGIKDVNGKEIYEGDIVHVDQSGTSWYVVYGYFGDAKFYVCNGINSGREIEDEDNTWVSFITEKEKFKLEVTGNIYENP